MNSDSLFGGILGVCVGDALGVPVEFKSRDYLKENPVREMIGNGTYFQPPGTWSDDSSLTLCLVDSLINGYDLHDIGQTFVKWFHENYWTPRGTVFDSGRTTREALFHLYKDIVRPEDAGGKDENSNGNGSLMRILPLAFYTKDLPLEQRCKIVSDVSSLTHGHISSSLACIAYVEFAIGLLNGLDPGEAYQKMASVIGQVNNDPEELRYFYRLTETDIAGLPQNRIRSSGYVVHTLEAGFWSLLTTQSYKECVLKAVNLGEDTDTTGAVAGGLAGIYYGLSGIPEEWLEQIARKNDIVDLISRFEAALTN